MKMSNDEIVDTILNMDSDDRLSKDVLEQIMKFVPSADEQNLLNSHADQLDMFAKSDRFLYEMSRCVGFLVKCMWISCCVVKYMLQTIV